MQHTEWTGSKYASEGLSGQKIAIVGYSHYEDGEDYPSLTHEIVERIRTTENYAFFTSIRNAFISADSADFWDRVLFFNFLPRVIGTARAKFETAGEDVHAEARSRVLRILRQHKPDKLVVFTSKGWDAFPDYPEEGLPMLAAPAIRSWGTYSDSDGHDVAAFGLAHTQGASSQGMKDAVRAILDLSVAK